MIPPVRRTAFFLIALMLVFCRVHAELVVLDPAQSQGTWEGWGTSLCWWAKAFGDRDDLADLLFTMKRVDVLGQKLPGLGMTIARYNVGACSSEPVDGRRMAVSKAFPPYKQMEGFWIDGAHNDWRSWKWNVDTNQRAALLKARDRGADHFELFSNSPMWWMCKNGNPSGSENGKDDNIAPQNYGKFAAYLATTARYAKDHWGIAFTSIEPFNEASADWWKATGKQEGCHISPATQAAILPLLRRELDARGLRDLPIAASDESLYDQAVNTWRSFDPQTKALVTKVNVHGYQYEKGDRHGLFEMTRGKTLWNSEYGENEPTGEKLARNLGLDFRDLRPTAWCYWQPFDGRGWAFIISDVANKKLQQVNPKFFVVAQYMRHIRPGMTILTTGDAETVAALDAKNRKLVLVAHNGGDQPAGRSYDLSKFNVPDGTVAQWLTEPLGTSRYREQKGGNVSAKRLDITLPAHSIATFEVQNVSAL